MIVELADGLARELIALGVAREIGDAIPAVEVVAADRLGELAESEMAEYLGVEVERLRSLRRSGGLPSGIWRKVGSSVLYLAEQMEDFAAGKWWSDESR